MFSAKTYQNRRSTLQKNVSQGLILLLGNIENPINFADNPYPFRQDSSFIYYFGIKLPKLAAVIDIDKNKTIVFGDELSVDEIVWMGIQETIKAKAEKSGVSSTKPFSQLQSYVEKANNEGRKIHFLPPYQSVNKILLSELLDTKIENLQPSVELIKAVVSQRERKEEQEVVQIENAVNIANKMHLLAMANAKIGMKEYELVSMIQKLAADQESRFSYQPIVTVDGQILHNHYYGNELKSGDMVLNDSGVENPMRYASDLTRTFPVDKTFTMRQKSIYSIVHQAFKETQSMLKPGVEFKEVHRKAALITAQGLIDMGLMKGAAEEAVKHNAHTLFFQTGLGHQMGLDVHDMEDLGEEYVGYTPENPKDTKTFGWKSLRLGKPLEKDFVITVEPGIYFIPQLIDMWQAENRLKDFINYDKVNEFRDFGGVRIEDDILITEDSYRVLGDGLISTAEEIENFRAEHLSQ
ncbi:MAG TPA: aminopeptidase P family protein [Flavobacteriaceae bacterium]|nr:aminopeptidase P family protein [Flavobacteriaceae bacterium]